MPVKAFFCASLSCNSSSWFSCKINTVLLYMIILKISQLMLLIAELELEVSTSFFTLVSYRRRLIENT
jgi:hypothetical protein